MNRKEAIEIIKDNFHNERGKLNEALETLIPELKESEDEKIRKEIIWAFNGQITYNSDRVEKYIAWLEKQGESSKLKHQPHEGDSDNHYDMSFEDAQQYASERGIDIPINDDEVFVDGRYITQTIGNILRWADEHLKGEQPKTGKKEEPIKKVHACDKCAKEHPGHSCADISELGRCRLDHEQETVEQKSLKIAKFKVGDILCRKGYIDHIITDIYDKREIPVYICKTDEGESYITFTDQDKWNLKPYWKPSEEQLQTLHAQTIEGAVSNSKDVRNLISLYNDLLKL